MATTRKAVAGSVVTEDEDRALAKVQLSQVGEDALANPDVKDGKVVEEDGKAYDRVEFKDEKFRIREKVGTLAMLKWASASELGTDDPRALGAIYAMLKAVILKEDWVAFEDHAMDTDADVEELFEVITSALEIVSGRPTQPA